MSERVGGVVRRLSNSSLEAMKDILDNNNADYDELFRDDAEDPTEPEESRGPQVRYDPTLTAVQAYAEREYGYDPTRGVSAFDPDSMNRVDVLDEEEVLDEVRAKRKRRRCIFAVGLVVVVGSVVIGSTVGFSKKNGGGSNVVESNSVLVAPPEALEQMCSIRNIATEEGHMQCEKACNAAACCMAAGTESCFLEQEGICGMYSPCGTLHSQTEGGTAFSSYTSSEGTGDGGVVVPPPPPDLETQCSDASLSTINGFIACQSACHPGKCCYAGYPEEDRGPYTSGASSSSDPYALQSCVQSHRDVCLGYAPCLALQGTGHQSPEQIVNRKCTARKVKTKEGRDACDDLCKARSCCFASSEKRNCRVDNKKWCEEYQACEVLLEKPAIEPHVGEFGDVDVIDSSAAAGGAIEPMEDKCQQSRIITHNDLVQCENACKPSLCCFYDDIQCDASFNSMNCDDYAFCRAIVSSMFSVGTGIDLDASGTGGGEDNGPGVGEYFDPSDAMGSAVAEACDPSNLGDPSGRSDCQVLCEPYMCCFDSGPNGCTSNRECPRYDECKNLMASSDGAGGIVPPNLDDTNIRPTDGGGSGYEVSDVNEACSVDNLVEDPDLCEELCSPMMCCFDFSEVGCYLNPECINYRACSLVINQQDAPPRQFDTTVGTTLAVEDACAPEKVLQAKGQEACYAICASFKCCFDGTCPNNQAICSEYKACEILFNSGDGSAGGSDKGSSFSGLPEPPADLDKVCDPAKIDIGENRFDCQELCLAGNCCRGVGTDCQDYFSYCEKFAPCEIVWALEAAKPEESGASEGGNVPSPAARGAAPEGGNESAPAAGGVETPTAPISTGTPSSAEGEGDPQTLCAPDKMNTPDGRAACDDVCRQWQCCWGDESQGQPNCFDEYSSTCLNYLVCPDA